jgi:hypothetical protein
MAAWSLPSDRADESAEWAHWLATEFLGRRGCDETCQALGALLCVDLVRHVLDQHGAPIHVYIDMARPQIELRVSASLIGCSAGDDNRLDLLRRLASSWGSDTFGDRYSAWCRFACLAENRSRCRHELTGP